VAEKTAHQLLDANGKATAETKSAPGWFVLDGDDLKVKGYSELFSEPDTAWAPLFSNPIAGNAVQFFPTGEEYFSMVAKAISGAKSSVFIAGWQVSYDVELVGKKTLFECLQDAVDGGAMVYVMPWLSPKAGVDTGDFDTLLAMCLMNAGRSSPSVYCLPAMQQGDQGTLGMFFAHHQKLVVIDNKEAYVGGIDLAYGRRDNGNYSLKAETRKLNELYNSCVPPTHKLSNGDQENCVTRAEMLSACLLDGKKGWVATFLTSPAETLAPVWDAKDTVTDFAKDTTASASTWLNENLKIEFIDQFKGTMQDVAVDSVQGISRLAWQRLDPLVRAKIEKLRDTGTANASNVASVVLAWLNNADLSQLPPGMIQPVANTIQALVMGVVAGLSWRAHKIPKRYDRFYEKIKVVPKSGTVLDTDVQPRMPWHDVHCRVEGPAVFDLARNFVLRWDGIARSYETSLASIRDPLARELLNGVGINIPPSPSLPRIAAAHLPTQDKATKGSNWVQVLRSAPMQLQKDEAAGAKDKTIPIRAQNNCLKGMVKAIAGAQKFIYIEGQFFQSAYGKDGLAAGRLSGPMAAMLDIRRSPGYLEFADMLGIRDCPVAEIPTRMRWAKVDDVMTKARGPAFLNDLRTVLFSLTTVEVTRVLGKKQDRVKNPISQALVNRIQRAIDDGLPFHVYLVLPVHPEGTLNTLNIMTQVHLTMHSLVLGEHSLVNGVRRAILAARYRKDRKMSAAQARAAAKEVNAGQLAEQIGDEWQQYLTLLNLRNWDMFGQRPVTEQIYVHSKLLIADDRVAILGSANINDRSMLGDRDSELAVIVTDEAQVTVKLDGVHEDKVAASVHKLRRDLWEKIFGLKSGNRKAPALASAAILDSPAAPTTWRAIQKCARDNAGIYEKAFWFVPRSAPRPEIQAKRPDDKEEASPFASLWPTWQYKNYTEHDEGGRLLHRMPFDEWFWHKPGPRDGATNTWNVANNAATGNAPEAVPKGVEGFIVALPIHWTRRENNLSGINLTVIADNGLPAAEAGQRVAMTGTDDKEAPT
jgi:phospholipase D1/2